MQFSHRQTCLEISSKAFSRQHPKARNLGENCLWNSRRLRPHPLDSGMKPEPSASDSWLHSIVPVHHPAACLCEVPDTHQMTSAP